MSVGARRAGTLPEIPTALACAGCGYQVPAGDPAPLRCPRARSGDDVDHVIVRSLDPGLPFPTGDEANPFVRYRTLFHAWHAARRLGWSDADYVTLVARVDGALAAPDGVARDTAGGHGFRVTPFARSDALSERLGFVLPGGVLVKDETGNVSGSHKARHLFGTLLELEVADAVRAAGGDQNVPGAAVPPFAIASCGNAALAAAVVARAAGHPLDVFIPPDADPAVVARLRALGARLEVCERVPGTPGDPTYHRLLAAVAAGAVPFTCQGNLNGLAIEGGETLGLEMVSSLVASGTRLDRLFVQVGGGALASSAIAAFLDASRLGVAVGVPRLHAVQTRGAFPLERAYRRVAARLLGEDAGTDPATLERLRVVATGPRGEEAFAYAAHHRSEFMWPWEDEPHSIAHGILDDETYDWLAVVRGILVTGGRPVVVDEDDVIAANEAGRDATGIDVDHTGSSGLAGLLRLAREGSVLPGETVAVLFTGAVRRPADPVDPSPNPTS